MVGEELSTQLHAQRLSLLRLPGSSLENPQRAMLVFILPDSKRDPEKAQFPKVCADNKQEMIRHLSA